MPRSNSAEQFPQHYEVTVPDAAGLVALQALGFRMQLSPDSREDTVTGDAFLAASEDLFGTDIYGRGARSYIRELRQGGYGSATTVDGYPRVQFDTQVYDYTPDLPYRDMGKITTQEQLEVHTRSLLADSNTPFLFLVQPAPDRQARLPKAIFAPGPLTIRGLAAFVENHSSHPLHGTIGKTLDVLAHTAGLMPSLNSTEFGKDDLISYDELMRTIDSAGIGRTVADRIKGKIMFAFFRQLKTGQPITDGEVIFDGGFELGAHEHTATVRYGSISRRSLEVIAQEYTRNTPARLLLKNLSA